MSCEVALKIGGSWEGAIVAVFLVVMFEIKFVEDCAGYSRDVQEVEAVK